MRILVLPGDGIGPEVVEQAKLVLGRMPSTAVFENTTRYNREEWTDLLGWLSDL